MSSVYGTEVERVNPVPRVDGRLCGAGGIQLSQGGWVGI